MGNTAKDKVSKHKTSGAVSVSKAWSLRVTREWLTQMDDRDTSGCLLDSPHVPLDQSKIPEHVALITISIT